MGMYVRSGFTCDVCGRYIGNRCNWGRTRLVKLARKDRYSTTERPSESYVLKCPDCKQKKVSE